MPDFRVLTFSALVVTARPPNWALLRACPETAMVFHGVQRAGIWLLCC